MSGSEFVAGIREEGAVDGRARIAGDDPGEAARDGLWKRVIDAGIALIADLPVRVFAPALDVAIVEDGAGVVAAA